MPEPLPPWGFASPESFGPPGCPGPPCIVDGALCPLVSEGEGGAVAPGCGLFSAGAGGSPGPCPGPNPPADSRRRPSIASSEITYRPRERLNRLDPRAEGWSWLHEEHASKTTSGSFWRKTPDDDVTQKEWARISLCLWERDGKVSEISLLANVRPNGSWSFLLRRALWTMPNGWRLLWIYG